MLSGCVRLHAVGTGCLWTRRGPVTDEELSRRRTPLPYSLRRQMPHRTPQSRATTAGQAGVQGSHRWRPTAESNRAQDRANVSSDLGAAFSGRRRPLCMVGGPPPSGTRRGHCQEALAQVIVRKRIQPLPIARQYTSSVGNRSLAAGTAAKHVASVGNLATILDCALAGVAMANRVAKASAAAAVASQYAS